METQAAVRALGALAQETRLEIFRLLVRFGPGGLAAGQIATRLGLAGATLSFHLAQLQHAGLLSSRRQGRQIFYAVDFGAIGALVGYMQENCCAEQPDVCRPLPARIGVETIKPRRNRGTKNERPSKS